jgi:hypothetical protein
MAGARLTRRRWAEDHRREVAMRLIALAPILAANLAVACPATAVLKHFDLRWTSIAEFNTSSPSPKRFPPGSEQRDSQAVIDDSNGGSPLLKRLTLVYDFSTTIKIQASLFFFASQHSEQGPRGSTSFTGTGDTATGIAWGLVTGWTITGGFFCHSTIAYYCGFARGVDLATVDPVLQSPFYALGTWTFHGTGFTSVPFVHQVAPPTSMSVGNDRYLLRGRLTAGIVPALPVLGVGLLGTSLLLAGARLSRRR